MKNRQPIRALIVALALAPGLISAMAVETVSVRPFDAVAVFLERQSAASVESLNDIVLSAEVAGRVVSIQARPGDPVGSGAVLLRLDEREYRIRQAAALAAVGRAEATLDMARIRAERARNLAAERFLSQDQLLEAETNLRLATAELEAARSELQQTELQLARTRIEAPFSGVVTRRMVGEGTLAAAGMPLLELVATTDIEITANIAPEQVPGLLAAEDVVFEAGNRSWPVRIERIAPVISRSSRAQQARLVFIDEAAPVGSEGRIRWTDPRPALPGHFIVQRNGEAGVLLLADDGVSVRFQALPGADTGRPYLATEPAAKLGPNARLIDEGRARVQPGQRVTVSSR